MKLQKQLSQRRGSKVYYKYLLIIPSELVEKLEWLENQELTAETRGRALTMKPV
jgi:hypothetical protein